jgi:glycine dehydrogenase
MMMAHRANRKNKSNKFLCDSNTHPQTITILQTRAKPLGIKLVVADVQGNDFSDCFAVLLQSPGTNGEVRDLNADIEKARIQNVLTIVACDLLALTLIKTPGEMGADIAIGNSQRFGVPMGFGGPHAAFLATRDEFKRMVPGRIIGVSQDTLGNPAMRMSLQTREQHIRRDKANSNICTAQVLLAVLAAAYGILGRCYDVYHHKTGDTHELQVALQTHLESLHWVAMTPHHSLLLHKERALNL